jgi:hypothetical protein
LQLPLAQQALDEPDNRRIRIVVVRESRDILRFPFRHRISVARGETKNAAAVLRSRQYVHPFPEAVAEWYNYLTI